MTNASVGGIPTPNTTDVRLAVARDLAELIGELAHFQTRLAQIISKFSDGEDVPPVRDQPSSELVERPPAEAPARADIPAEVVPTAKDRILDLYASTDILLGEIATRLDVPRGTVNGTLSLARKAKDARALEGDERRLREQAKGQSPTRALPKNRTIAFYDGGERRPVVPPMQERVEPGDDLYRVHVASLTVHGPVASIQVSREIALILARMDGDGLFDFRTLQECAGWKQEDSLHHEMSLWATRLFDAGIDIVKVARFGYRARRAES